MLSKFIRRRIHDILLYASMRAYLRFFPGTTLEEAAKGFIDDYRIPENEFRIKTLITTYQRMADEFRGDSKEFDEFYQQLEDEKNKLDNGAKKD